MLQHQEISSAMPRIYPRRFGPDNEQDNAELREARVVKVSNTSDELSLYLLQVVSEAFHSVANTTDVPGSVVQQIHIVRSAAPGTRACDDM